MFRTRAALPLLAAVVLAISCASGGVAESHGEEETAPAARSIEVAYANGDLPLAAELLMPGQGEGPFPAAVIIQGSGTSDRTNRWARDIARELVGNGLAVLLTDKRGSGQSGGDWRRVGFGELAADALAGVRFLAGRPDVDGERVGLVGLSQGGRVAPIAAAVAPDEVAFVVNVSGSSVSFAEQSFFEMRNTARQAGLDEAGVLQVLELNRLAARQLMADAWDDYEAARAEGLAGAAAKVVEGFPAEREDPIWTFYRRAWTFDPLPYWMLVKQPLLTVYGGADENDNVPVAESVRRLEFAFATTGHEAADILVLESSGHGLRDPGTGALDAELTTTLAAWLERHVGR